MSSLETFQDLVRLELIDRIHNEGATDVMKVMAHTYDAVPTAFMHKTPDDLVIMVQRYVNWQLYGNEKPDWFEVKKR